MEKAKKRCSICGRWYQPNPRTYNNQTSCKKASCQKERKRRANKSWQKRHSGYEQSRQAKKRDWAQAYPDYWQQYRKKHPDYQARERQRMQSVRDRAAIVANQDAIAKIAVEQLASIPRCEQQNVANQAVMDRRVDTVVEYLLWKERVANQDAIGILPSGMP